MKVAIEARALEARSSGVKTYVKFLLAALEEKKNALDVNVMSEGPSASWQWIWWLEHTLPNWIASVQPDVVHYTKPMVPMRKFCPTVVTIYDVIPLIFPESQRIGARQVWPAMLKRAARQADRIITISHTSKRDITERLGVPEGIITVTPLAVSEDRFANVIGDANVKDAYILFVGTIEPRKNIQALIRSFHRISLEIPHKLLLVGATYKGLDDIAREIDKLNLRERVEIRGSVSERELINLYLHADLFVLPSLYEGWGFPAQEAMMAGVPVIVSDGGSLPEVVGKAGEIVSFSSDVLSERLHDEDFEIRLAETMAEILHTEAKQVEMKDAGKHQASSTSWREVADKTASIYSALAV